MAERRSDQRIKVTSNVKIYRANSSNALSGESKLRNLSWKGFSILSENQMKVGETLVFTITPELTPITLSGTICHAQYSSGIFICGVRITHINMLSRPALRRFVNHHQPDLKHPMITCAVGGGLGLISVFVLGLSMGTAMAIGAIAAIGYYLFSPA